MNTIELRPDTVRLVKQLLVPLMDRGVISNGEIEVINEQLMHYAKYGKAQLNIQPRLLTTEEVANLLGIAPSELRKLQHDGELPFPRHRVGQRSVRYLNTEVYRYMEIDSIIQPASNDKFKLATKRNES